MYSNVSPIRHEEWKDIDAAIMSVNIATKPMLKEVHKHSVSFIVVKPYR